MSLRQGIPHAPRKQPWFLDVLQDQRGQLIPVVLAVMVIIAITSSAFVINLVVRQQLEGYRYRVMVARYLAEAALERARWALESGVEDPAYVAGSLDITSSTGASQQGRYRVETLRDEGDGLLSLLAIGEFAGIQRAIKAQVKLSPRVLAYAIFAQGPVRLEGDDSRTYLIPAPLAAGTVEGGHLGVNTEVRFINAGVAVNNFSGVALSLREGPQYDYALIGLPSAPPEDQRTGKLVLAGGAGIMFGVDRDPLSDAAQLRGHGVRFGMEVASTRKQEALPSIDRTRMRALAEANFENAEVNQAVGSRTRPSLQAKRDSLYDRDDFIHILRYLAEGPPTPLKGAIYVKGPVVVPKGSSQQILDGFLVLEGGLTIHQGARLEIRHATKSRAMPGLVTVGGSFPVVVEREAMLAVDGLVYAGGGVRCCRTVNG